MAPSRTMSLHCACKDTRRQGTRRALGAASSRLFSLFEQAVFRGSRRLPKFARPNKLVVIFLKAPKRYRGFAAGAAAPPGALSCSCASSNSFSVPSLSLPVVGGMCRSAALVGVEGCGRAVALRAGAVCAGLAGLFLASRRPRPSPFAVARRRAGAGFPSASAAPACRRSAAGYGGATRSCSVGPAASSG